MELKLNDLRGSYVKLVNHVINRGEHVVVRDMPTRELTAVTMIIPNTLEPLLPIGVGRGVNLKLAALEALQLISGVARADLVRVAAPTFESVLVDATDPDYGAYGPRVVEQLADCIALLKDDPSSRQAIVSIWNKADLRHVGDKPCTVFFQFLIRESGHGFAALEMHTHMRSQDVWLGVPYDIFMFTQLQHTIANELRMPVGQYVHHTTSLHIYERDIAAANKLHAPTDIDFVDLPLGICSPNRETYSIDIAAYLLDGNTTTAEDEANPWYTKQLDLIETLLPSEDTVPV
jgi:thymidylate synthase